MRISSNLIATLGAFVSAVVFVPAAMAGCGDVSVANGPFTMASNGSAQAPQATQAAKFVPSAQFQTGSGDSVASIVGMWSFQFISKGNLTHMPSIPDGALLDFGYTQWHGDGTEILNSGGRAPATENFCMGTWARTDFFGYQLRHFTLGYDATSGALTSKGIIIENVTLDPSGNSFSGTITIEVFDPTGAHLVDQLTGTVTATRLTVNTTNP